MSYEFSPSRWLTTPLTNKVIYVPTSQVAPVYKGYVQSVNIQAPMCWYQITHHHHGRGDCATVSTPDSQSGGLFRVSSRNIHKQGVHSPTFRQPKPFIPHRSINWFWIGPALNVLCAAAGRRVACLAARRRHDEWGTMELSCLGPQRMLLHPSVLLVVC